MVLTALLLLAQAEVGLPLPSYDVDRICRSDPMYSAAGYVKACVESEQSAYDALKAEWPEFDEADRRYLLAIDAKVKTRIHYTTIQGYASSMIASKEARRPPSAFRP